MTALHHTSPKQLKIFFETTRLILLAYKNGHRMPDLNPLEYSVWDILQELVDEGMREPFANLKDLQNVIRDKWHDVDDQTVRKAILQWK